MTTARRGTVGVLRAVLVLGLSVLGRETILSQSYALVYQGTTGRKGERTKRRSGLGRRSIASVPSWRGGLANSKYPPETRHQGRPDAGRGNGASFRSLYSMTGPTDAGRVGSSDASETGVLGNFVRIPQTPPLFARNIVPETPVQPDPYRCNIYNVTMSPLSTSRRSATGRNAFLLFSGSSEFRGPTTRSDHGAGMGS